MTIHVEVVESIEGREFASNEFYQERDDGRFMLVRCDAEEFTAEQGRCIG